MRIQLLVAVFCFFIIAGCGSGSGNEDSSPTLTPKLTDKYNVVIYGSDHGGADTGASFTSGIATANFDNLGGYTGAVTTISQGQPSGEAFSTGSFSGSYSLNTSGELTLDSLSNGFVSADENILIWAPVPGDITSEETGIAIALKTSFGLSNATLNGSYGVVNLGSDHGGADTGAKFSSAIATINFNGLGSYSGTITAVSQGQPSGEAFTTGSISGTYSVLSNGQISLDGLNSGFVSTDGSLLVWAPVPGDIVLEETGIGVAVKRGIYLSDATLNGSYNIVNFSSDHGGADTGAEFTSGIATIYFDGLGGYTGAVTAVSQGQPIGEAFTTGTVGGTYTVLSNGQLTLDGIASGFVSADGRILVWAPVPGEVFFEETGIAIGLKAP